eukprot:6509889-Pyramimonas_sp.AAC.1
MLLLNPPVGGRARPKASAPWGGGVSSAGRGTASEHRAGRVPLSVGCPAWRALRRAPAVVAR